ncbi:sugar phosphate isomerase [Bacteroidia bacterium]|nr:sugar phosphate isomerase [Bacteroidia bacterium]
MKTLKSVLLVVCAILTISCCCNSEKKAVENLEKNIGLQMYSLRGPISDTVVVTGIDSVIKAVGQMGYKYVENFGYNESDGLTWGLSPEELKAKFNAVGVDILSTHVRKDLPADKVKAGVDELWAWWDKCIADHKAMGAKYIVMPSMPTPETLEGLQAYCDYYNTVGEKCQAAGLKFGYHNHNFEFEKKYDTAGGSISMYDYLVQHTDPAKVFFELDVYWAIVGRRAPVELFEQYPGRFEVLHIKDSKELGRSGFVGFDAIFNHIDLAKTKYLIVEVERYNIPPIESVKESLDYLNKADFVKANYAE